MSAKVEEVAAIKAKIVKTISEVEHGDHGAAIMALAEAVLAHVEYTLEREEQIPVFKRRK